eukprot:TRINITY_DN76530_c0_g1_i1.p1 TRINITY_DN76530_c0_g1~~TRINITY_DN76530_c0_g1_i1.p1  ORF type:complete len:316 (+),score=25.43 TRINITY_DN76530_c0_g1_i1:126-1073(+)
MFAAVDGAGSHRALRVCMIGVVLIFPVAFIIFVDAENAQILLPGAWHVLPRGESATVTLVTARGSKISSGPLAAATWIEANTNKDSNKAVPHQAAFLTRDSLDLEHPRDDIGPLHRSRHRHRGQASFLVHLGAALLYYFVVVSRYRSLKEKPLSGKRFIEIKSLDQINPLFSLCDVRTDNICLSYYCTNVRAAHTFAKTGACGFWQSWCAMYTCAPCTLCYLQNTVRKALGMREMGLANNICSSLLCSCCVVAQHAEALDIATNQRWCGHSGSDTCATDEDPDVESALLAPGQSRSHQLRHIADAQQEMRSAAEA